MAPQRRLEKIHPMATIVIRNTQKRALIINHDKHQLTFPAGRTEVVEGKDGQKSQKFVPGEATAESTIIEAARKRYQVVEHWFKEGWLVIAKAVSPKQEEE